MTLQIRPWIRYALRRAGLPGLVGLTLLGCVTAGYVAIIRPIESTSVALQEEIAAAARRGTASGEIFRTHATRSEKIHSFRNFFPPGKSAFGWIGTLNQIAEREGLQLTHGEYRPDDAKDKHPQALQILLPVQGNYAQIRRFVSGALAEIPFIALDEIEFERNASSGKTVEAKLRFTLYLRRDPLP